MSNRTRTTVGKTYGHLTVIKDLGVSGVRSYGHLWLWQCDCGSEITGTRYGMVTSRTRMGKAPFCGNLERHPEIEAEDTSGRSDAVPAPGDEVRILAFDTNEFGRINGAGQVLKVYTHSAMIASDSLPRELNGRVIVPFRRLKVISRSGKPIQQNQIITGW